MGKQQPECPVVKEPFDLADTSQVVETRRRAGTSMCVRRQLLVYNNSKVTNRRGCLQYATRKMEIFGTLIDPRELLSGTEPDYV